MRLLYLVSHPIQYQAPLLRLIAADPGIELQVLFEHVDTASAYHDAGFAREVEWDVPLTGGYDHQVATSIRDVDQHLTGTDVMWVHGWDSPLRRRALDRARQRNVPVLMRGENTLAAMPDGAGPRGLLKRLYLQWIFRRCAGFLCIGSDNRAYYRQHGVAESHLFEMPYTVDNEAFFAAAAAADTGALRRELGLAADRPVVLFAGKFLGRKNPALLLEAMQRLNREAAQHPYLLFAGDGDQRPALEKRADGADWVRFLGFQNQGQLPPLYALADLFVLPSQREPWGLAVNEAMACGTAVVVTDECGCAADLVREDCGRVLPAGDAGALQAALEDLLGNPEVSRRMGAAARARIATWSYQEALDGLKTALSAVA